MIKKILMILSALMLTFVLAEETLVETMPASPVLMLKSNPSTGYTWNWQIASEEDVVSVTSTYISDFQPENENDIMLPGTGGHDRISLTGLQQGEAIITFTYKRVWEEAEPLYTLKYRVVVDASLNVTILSSSFDW